MFLKNRQIGWIFSIILIFTISCKSQKDTVRLKIKESPESLVKKINANELHFNTFSTKVDFSIKTDESTRKLKANIRIKKDSIIWISITPLLGIEVARVLITQDSVKVINRLGKEYFLGDYDYIDKRFNVHMEFEVMQAVLIGNSIPFELTKDLKFAADKDLYYLGNMKKRKARKVANNPQKVERQDEEVVSLWISPTSSKIEKFIFSDLTADRFILGTYDQFESIDEQLIPQHLTFQVQSKKPSFITIDYSRTTLDKDLSFSFNISSKYEQVVY